MADHRKEGDEEPSLELPSLRLPRLKRRKRGADQAEQPTPASAPQDTAHPDPLPPRPRERLTQQGSAPQQASPAAEEPVHSGSTASTARHEDRPRAVSDEDPSGAGVSTSALAPQAAAAVTGLAVGITGVMLTTLGLGGCEALRGTSTCGRPGFFMLVAILLVMVLVGAALLKLWQVTDPTSTSFLAVGIVTVIAMLVLLDVIFSPWMFVVIPALGVLAYVGSHWVTTRFSEGDRDIVR